MSNASPTFTPVAELPFIDSLRELTHEERITHGLILPSGHKNDYRLERMKGRGASSSDATWDRQTHHHTCCQSRSAWRHKVDCPMLKFDDEEVV